MKQTSGNKKSNLVILAIVGAIVIIIGVLCLISSGQEPETDGGWKGKTKAEAQEELDNAGLIGGVLLVVGVGIELLVYYKSKSNSSSITNETETLNRYETRLKELNENLQNNKISEEIFEERKNKILDDLINDVDTLDLLKKRIKEMTIDGIISQKDNDIIIDKLNNNVKKSKNKKTNIICICIIIFLVVITIVSIMNTTKRKNRLGLGVLKNNTITII